MSSLHSIVASETPEVHCHDLQVSQKHPTWFSSFLVKFGW